MIDLDEMDILDEDENEKLVKVDNDIFDDWRLLIDNEGNTYMLKDEQGMKPNTMDEARNYDWVPADCWAET